MLKFFTSGKALMMFFIVILFLAIGHRAIAADVGITSGSASGTYFAVAKDIQDICKPMTVNVYESAGSLSNIDRVLTDKRTQYGIVQSDSLLYKTKIMGDKQVEAKIKMIFPLYNEEVHLIVAANSTMRKFSDFAGRKVVVGAEGSGNYVTSQIMKAKSNIDWEDLQISPQDGVTQLLLGQVDAVIMVGGKPMSFLQKLGNAAKGKLRLVPIENSEVDNYYIPTTIPEGLYDWSTRPVTTIAVKSILITYDFKSQYQDDIQKLAACISTNLDTLQGSGKYHAKWREVDPADYKSVKWPVSPVAERYLKRLK